MASTSALPHEQDTLLNSLMLSLRRLPRERWVEVQTFIEFLAYQQKDTTDNTVQLGELDLLSVAELVQIAKSTVPVEQSGRLKELLSAQQQRLLTLSEEQEAAALVQQEDLYTLRKAKALHLLKQRDALPSDLHEILA